MKKKDLITMNGEKIWLHFAEIAEDQWAVTSSFDNFDVSGSLYDVVERVADNIGLPLENRSGYRVRNKQELHSYLITE